MQYLLYYVVCLGFEAPLGNCLWPMLGMQHWPIVGYLRNGTPIMQRSHQHGTRRPVGLHPPLVVIHITHNLYQF